MIIFTSFVELEILFPVEIRAQVERNCKLSFLSIHVVRNFLFFLHLG